jgi:hypothetical protein
MQSFSFLLRHIPGKLNKIADYLSRLNHIDTMIVPQEVYSLLYDILGASAKSESESSIVSHIHSTDNHDVLATVTEQQNPQDSQVQFSKLTYTQALSQVHGGRMGHLGAPGTWLALNKYFPGHRVPYLIVADYVATCAICQKLRLNMNDSIKPIVRHIKPLHHRAVVGVDTLTITHEDELGNSY